MNKVLLIGRIASELEIQQTTGNNNYVRFRIAVKRPYNKNEVDFLPVIAWKNQADFISTYLTKGSMLSVEGRLNASQYESKDGKKMTRYEIIADRVQGLETKAHTEARSYSKTDELSMKNSPSQDYNAHDEIIFEEENTNSKNDLSDDVPWDVDL